MAKSSSVIEINGNRYDAITGQMIGTVKRVAYHVKKTPSGVIDGFTKGTSPVQAKPLASTTSAQTIEDTNKDLRKFAQKVHKRTQRSKTLMRASVQKSEIKSQKAGVKNPGHSVKSGQIDYAKQARANLIHRSPEIQRFGVPSRVTAARSESSGTKAVALSQNDSHVLKAPAQNSLANISSQQLERLLDHALVRADAHKRVFRQQAGRGLFGKAKLMPKWASIGVGFAVVGLIAGLFAWQNIPQVSMQVAATRASIPASVPGYTPSGFSFEGPIGYSGGAVSIKFKANADSQRTFTLTQEKSDWTTETLAANTVPEDSQVQTSQVKGTTVYIYGEAESRATWVDKGVRYTLVDKANLNSDQILKIAGSL